MIPWSTLNPNINLPFPLPLLQDHPLETFKSAVDFMNLKYEESDIINAINNSSFDTLKAMEISEGFKERGMRSEAFFRKGISNEWETVLSLTQIKAIVKHHNKIMKKFGYLRK